VIGRNLLKTIAPSAALLVLLSQQFHRPPSSGQNKLAQAPKVMLWAWERPERLSFLDSPDIGVAYLPDTIYQQGDGFLLRPRIQPLYVLPNTYLEAVVRIETDRTKTWNLSAKETDNLAAAIVNVVNRPSIKALQIDFDARQSERAFYKQLIEKIRARLPQGMPLSITALASWCMGDKWLSDAAVDEVVPMLFSMGAGEQEASNFIQTSRSIDLGYFERSLGSSADEPVAAYELSKRVNLESTRFYFFTTRPWKPVSVKHIQDEVRLWKNNSSNQWRSRWHW
jgi:hypothetical protein